MEYVCILEQLFWCWFRFYLKGCGCGGVVGLDVVCKIEIYGYCFGWVYRQFVIDFFVFVRWRGFVLSGVAGFFEVFGECLYRQFRGFFVYGELQCALQQLGGSIFLDEIGMLWLSRERFMLVLEFFVSRDYMCKFRFYFFGFSFRKFQMWLLVMLGMVW